MKINLILFLLVLEFFYSNAINLKILELQSGSNIVYAKEDDDLMLTCQHDGISIAGQYLEWYSSKQFDPILETNDNRKMYITIAPNGDKQSLSLTIRSIKSGDIGLYSCKYMIRENNNIRAIKEVTASVQLQKDIDLINCANEQWVLEGSSSLIRCEIRGFPAPIVSWRFGSKDIGTGGRYIQEQIGLKISEISSSDGGIYTVIAKQDNKAVFTQQNIFVRVYTKPRIIFGPKIIAPYPDVVMEHWPAELQCIATGNPQPTVHWFRKKSGENNELQLVNPNKFFVNTNGRVGKVRILNPQYPYDDDVYICKAMVSTSRIISINEDMFTEAEFRVRVIVVPQFVLLDRFHVSKDPGETVKADCSVYASKPIQLQFIKYGTDTPYQLGVQPDDPRISVDQTENPLNPMNHTLRLTIRDAKFSDSWNYTCVATNPAGTRYWNASVSIWIKPKMNSSEIEHFGYRNNATNLTCVAIGLPHPKWTWYRALAQILNNINDTFQIISWDYEIYSVSWLQINPVYGMERWIFDEYRCNATNERGTNVHVIYFRQASIPGQPIVELISVTSSSVEYRVTASNKTGGMPVLTFEVEYKGTGGRSVWYGPVFFPLDSTVRIAGLVGGTFYQAQIYSRNFVGRSYPTTVTFETNADQYPEPVKIISSPQSIYPYSYWLRWIIPFNGGSPLFGYRIMIRPLKVQSATIEGAKGDWRELFPPFMNPNMNEYRILYLLPDTAYQVRIQAQNKFGFSPVDAYKPPIRYRLLHSLYSNKANDVYLKEGGFIFWTTNPDKLGEPPIVYGAADKLLYSKCFVIFSIICLHYLFSDID